MEGKGCVWGYPLDGRQGWSHAEVPTGGLWPLPGAEYPQPGTPVRLHGSCIPDSLHLDSSPSLVRQYADICLFNTAQYKCPVAMEEAE